MKKLLILLLAMLPLTATATKKQKNPSVSVTDLRAERLVNPYPTFRLALGIYGTGRVSDQLPHHRCLDTREG